MSTDDPTEEPSAFAVDNRRRRELDGIAVAYDALFHHELPAAVSCYFTAGTPPGSMMSRAIAATADVLADLIVDLLERWDHLDDAISLSAYSSTSTSSANWSISRNSPE